MANLITTSEIIDIESIKRDMEELAKAIKADMEEVKTSIQGAASALQGFSGDKGVSSQAAEIERMTTQIKTQKQAIAELQRQMEKLSSTPKLFPDSDNTSLIQSYKTLTNVLQEAGVSLESLTLTEKAKNQITKQGELANKSAQGSYNQLAAQYNLLKIALNALNGEMRANVNIGGKLEKEALKIMNSMKSMQEATGKHTLSVGDYSKALNGLNIATTQVLREMPTIANSWSQFFIAISNNVPIFVDQFTNVVRATNSVKTALMGTLSAIFSWQTALLVLLTYLPKLAQRLHENKKATSELADETQKLITYYNLMREVSISWAKAEVDTATEMRTWVKVAQDANRTQEDRINAGNRLKQMFNDELEAYTAEDIAMGNANSQLDIINEKLQKQAYIRASLNKLTEFYSKQIDLEIKAEELGQKSYTSNGVKLGSVEQISARIDKYTALGFTMDDIKNHFITLTKDVWKEVDAYRQTNKELTELGKSIEKVQSKIPTNGILEEITDGKGKTSGTSTKKPEELGDYYRKMANAFIDTLSEGTTKESIRTIFATEFAVEDVKAEMEKVRQIAEEQGLDATEQLSQLNSVIDSLYKKRDQDLEKYHQQWLAKLDKWAQEGAKEIEQADEDFRAQEDANFNAEVQSLNAHYDNLDLLAIANNKNRYNRTREQLQNEMDYWEDYRNLLIKEGRWTESFEEEFIAKQEALGQKKAETLPNSFLGFIGMWADEGWSQKFEQNLSKTFNTAFSYMEQWMDARIEMAQVAIDAAQEEKDAAKETFDYEREARANGYANNVELALREYQEKIALEQEAIKEKQRLQKIQEGVDTATQVSSLVTATANLWSSLSGVPLVGAILAAAATATMFGSFIAAKVQAAKVAGVTYGDGMSEYLDYGGSHASGNDIDFGVNKDGVRRRVERGEVIGVINKRNVRKYGAEEVQNIINSLNRGNFEQKYGNAFADLSINNSTDISGISSDVKAIKEQGESRIYSAGGKTIKVYKNLTRIIK